MPNSTADTEQNPDSYISAARALKQAGRLEEALAILAQGVEVCAPSASLYEYYIERLEKCNQTRKAIALAARAAVQFPEDLIFKFWELLLLPVVYESSAELESYRSRYSEGLAILSRDLSLDTPDARRHALAAIGKYVNYYVGYQAGNVTGSQLCFGALVHRIMAANFPEWTKPLPMPAVSEDGKLRIGYVSSVFFEHSSLVKSHLGWVREHDRQQFNVYTYYTGQTSDSVTEEVKRISQGFRHFPNALEDMCRAILADQLHAVIYLDIGLRPITAQLASLRLAPVQCATLEAPLTTGISTVDYYLSSDLMEPDDAVEHYTEELVRLPGVGMCYRKPVIPEVILNKTRADFGLREDAVVYLCCQALAKYLPDHDEVFWRIAKLVPNAQFVFLAPNELLGKDFAARLERAFAEVGMEARENCTILPTFDLLNYWNLHLVADVFLDTIGWSGNNSTFEAVACRLPVVTLPGRSMRERHSYAILKQLGVTETIASNKNDYVEIAARLGLEPDWRKNVVRQMSFGFPQLYSDTRSVRAIEDLVRRRVGERLADL